MSLLRRFRRFRGQTTSEYMLMISVVSIGVWLVLKAFSDPNGPVQTGAESLTNDLESSLSNEGSMRAQ